MSPDLRDLIEAVLDGRAGDLGPQDRARALQAATAVVLALAVALPAPDSGSALSPGDTMMTLAEVARLELTRFRGHLTFGVGGSHDAEEEARTTAAVPA